MTALTCPQGTLRMGPGLPTVLINDQLRVLDQADDSMLQRLRAGDLSTMLESARAGAALGLDMVDILVFHPELDEVDLLARIARRVIDEVGCPVSLDSRSPEALEAALREIAPYKAVINSVSAEAEVLETLLPLAARYGAAVFGMPVGAGGLPRTVEARVAEAARILEACDGAGIPREDVILDGVLLAPAAEPGSFEVTLATLRRFREQWNLATTLGIGNAGYGLPDATVVDLAFLLGAQTCGLSAALVNPATRGLVETARAMDFLTGTDPAGKRYIRHFRARKSMGEATR